MNQHDTKGRNESLNTEKDQNYQQDMDRGEKSCIGNLISFIFYAWKFYKYYK